MNSKMLLSVVVGAMVLCPGIRAGGDNGTEGLGVAEVAKTGLWWTTRGALFVSEETVGAVLVSHGLKQAVKGVKQAAPAVAQIVLDTLQTIIGQEDQKAEHCQLYWNALSGSLRGLYGAMVATGAAFGMIAGAPAVDRWLAKLMHAKKEDK